MKNKDQFDLSHPGRDPLEALRYLINLREFIFLQTPPSRYLQQPHSDDFVPVRGNIEMPAMLDASYVHFGRYLLSISIPGFIRHDEPFEFKKDAEGKERVHYLPGVTGFNIDHSLKGILNCFGIQTEETKYGKDKLSDTYYIEFEVKNKEDYKIGRCIIQKIIHGNYATDKELRSEIEKIIYARKPKSSASRRFTALLRKLFP